MLGVCDLSDGPIRRSLDGSKRRRQCIGTRPKRKKQTSKQLTHPGVLGVLSKCDGKGISYHSFDPQKSVVSGNKVAAGQSMRLPVVSGPPASQEGDSKKAIVRPPARRRHPGRRMLPRAKEDSGHSEDARVRVQSATLFFPSFFAQVERVVVQSNEPMTFRSASMEMGIDTTSWKQIQSRDWVGLFQNNTTTTCEFEKAGRP